MICKKYYITYDDGQKIEYTESEFLRLLELEIKDYCEIADRNGMGYNLTRFLLNLLCNDGFYLDINGYVYEVEYYTMDVKRSNKIVESQLSLLNYVERHIGNWLNNLHKQLESEDKNNGTNDN